MPLVENRDMRLAKILTDEADELILRCKQRPSQATMDRVTSFTRSVRSDAHYAYLDGKLARSRALNKLADKVGTTAIRMKIVA